MNYHDLRCRCGRFVRPDAISYTTFGSYEDVEPPEECFICARCWERMAASQKRTLAYISWSACKEIREWAEIEGSK